MLEKAIVPLGQLSLAIIIQEKPATANSKVIDLNDVYQTGILQLKRLLTEGGMVHKSTNILYIYLKLIFLEISLKHSIHTQQICEVFGLRFGRC